ncbi:MAG: class I SAM-dependent methyltransferase [Candidatus Dormibacteria bacterium]
MSTDPYAGALGRAYSWYIRRPGVGRRVGRAVWGSDFGPMYESLQQLARLPGESAVLDVPCGAGLSLHFLEPSRTGTYLGVDASPAMLARARRVAQRRGFAHVELHEADITAIPMADASADVCLLYNGLHCVDDPQAALAEVVRCLRPSGRLVGSMLVRGGSRRADRTLAREAARPHGMTRAGGTLTDLRGWLESAGLTGIEALASGAVAVFSGSR